MFSVDKYINSIKDNLEKQSALLVRNLRKVISYKFSSDIEILDFIVFIEPIRFELSIRLFSMDKEANEVFYNGDDSSVFAGSEDVIPEIKYFHINNNQLEDFFDFHEQNENILDLQEQKAFTDWFIHCWEKAGGTVLTLPSYFVFNDTDKSYDLRSNKWIEDEEKWS